MSKENDRVENSSDDLLAEISPLDEFIARMEEPLVPTATFTLYGDFQTHDPKRLEISDEEARSRVKMLLAMAKRSQAATKP